MTQYPMEVKTFGHCETTRCRKEFHQEMEVYKISFHSPASGFSKLLAKPLEMKLCGECYFKNYSIVRENVYKVKQ